VSAWLLVAGDFVPFGGMDVANYNLARYLAIESAADVHLVTHRASEDLRSLPNVRVHHAARPLGGHRLGEPLLRLVAGRWHRKLGPKGVRTIANGGNIDAGDVNWVHYVHAGFDPRITRRGRNIATGASHPRYVREEAQALRRARVVICNSRRTADDVVTRVGVPPGRARVVYYGADPVAFSPVEPMHRAEARRALGVTSNRPIALFVGALGDRRKGFDTLFAAWMDLCRRRDWDVDLFVAGSGAELRSWRTAAAAQIPGRITFLGFHRNMPGLFAAADLVVHPARYEPYGLAAHEALCRGIPAIVSRQAGVAERYPADLQPLLLDDPESVEELRARLLRWREGHITAERVATFAETLRSRTWTHMSAEIAAAAEDAAA
jgi:glycosyltransferase involved in cell wall biosynthesis